MKRMLKSWPVALLLCLSGAILFGVAAIAAQEAPMNSNDPSAEVSAIPEHELWERVEAIRAELDAASTPTLPESEIEAKLENALGLLNGEDGVIPQLQALLGVSDDDLPEAEAVISADSDPPEVIALAHLVLAADVLSNGSDQDSVQSAREHVAQALELIAPPTSGDESTE